MRLYKVVSNPSADFESQQWTRARGVESLHVLNATPYFTAVVGDDGTVIDILAPWTRAEIWLEGIKYQYVTFEDAQLGSVAAGSGVTANVVWAGATNARVDTRHFPLETGGMSLNGSSALYQSATINFVQTVAASSSVTVLDLPGYEVDIRAWAWLTANTNAAEGHFSFLPYESDGVTLGNDLQLVTPGSAGLNWMSPNQLTASLQTAWFKVQNNVSGQYVVELLQPLKFTYGVRITTSNTNATTGYNQQMVGLYAARRY